MKIFTKERLLNPRALILADQTVMSASGFLANFLMAWKLQLTQYGQYALVFIGMMLLMSLQQALFIQPAQVFFPRFRKEQQQKLTGSLLILALPVLIIASVILEVVYELVYDIHISTGILSLVTLFWLLADLLRKLAIMLRPGISLVIIDCIYVLVFLGSILLFSPANISSGLLISGLSATISLAFIFVIKPQIPGFRIFNFTLFRCLPTAGWMVLTSAVQWSSSNYLLLAAGSWLNSASLGLLRLAQYLYGLLNIFLQAYENYAVPRLVAYTGEGSRRNRYLIKFSLPFLLPVVLLLCVITILFPWLFSFVSTETTDFPVHYWLSVLYLLIVTGYPVRVYIRASKYNPIYFGAHALSLLFILMSASYLIINFETAGVIMGLIMSQAIMLAVWAAFLFRKNEVSWRLSTSL